MRKRINTTAEKRRVITTDLHCDTALCMHTEYTFSLWMVGQCTYPPYLGYHQGDQPAANVFQPKQTNVTHLKMFP